MRALALKVTPA